MRATLLIYSSLQFSFLGKTSSLRQYKHLVAMSLAKNNSGSLQETYKNSHSMHNSTTEVSEWKTLDTQVGGHQFAHGEYEHQKLGIVDIGNGLILKSLQNPPRGTRELNFYQQVFNPNCDDVDLLELRNFMSPFYGTEEKGKAKFLKLANLTSSFKCPCVIDLKMGKVTYDQEATAVKIAHEVEKYPPLKTLGFQITGMMIYNPVTQLKEQYGKSYCRVLTEENITHDGLGRFFQLHNNDLRKDVIQQLLPKLKKLEAWFLKQKKFSFIASSLLIVYEGFNSTKNEFKISDDLLDTISNKNNSNDLSKVHPESAPIIDTMISNDSKSVSTKFHKRASDGEIIYNDDIAKRAKLSEEKHSQSDSSEVESLLAKDVQVHLIDFAHAFPADDVDHNFLFGLQKLIDCLHTLIK